MRVLIPTQRSDTHAKIVARALLETGHTPVLWYGNDLPQRQAFSVEFNGSAEPRLVLRGAAIGTSSPFDVVWFRRPAPPVLPDDMHSSDRAYATREWTQLLRGIWSSIGSSAFWVNPYPAAAAAEAKLVQLGEAARVGLRTPPTLCSNDPDRIRAFIRSNRGDTIFKSFTSAMWRAEETAAYLFTAVVTEDDLPADEALRLTPGIFQPRLPKAYELRVTVIGDRVFAVKLDSQASEAANLDWRIGIHDLQLTRTTLPREVEAQCLALLGRLGLVFGCLDFIVTPKGDHVFLEVNQMGQFLWLEQSLPDLALLDAFCALLTQRRCDFTWSEAGARLRFADLHDPQRHDAVDAPHLEVPAPHVVSESAGATLRRV